MSPTIYGFGSGYFNKQSIQISMLTRASLKAGQALVIGDGKGVWNYVHIDDLTDLYILLLQKILHGETVPSGEQILFSETGTFSWNEASQGIADALFKLGAIKTVDVKQVSLEDIAGQLFAGDMLLAEVGFASKWVISWFFVDSTLLMRLPSSRTKSDLARELGWKPVKTEQDFKNHFLAEAKLILEATR